MADEPTKPEGGSEGKKSGFLGKKLGPLSVGGWGFVVVGMVVVLFIMRSKTSGTKTTGRLAGGSAGTGVTNVDPLTGEQLLSALNNLTTALKNGAQPPVNANPGGFGIVTVIDKARFGLQQGDKGPPIWMRDAAGNFTEAFRLPWNTTLQVLGPMQNGWLPVLGPGGSVMWLQEFDISRWTNMSGTLPTPPPSPVAPIIPIVPHIITSQGASASGGPATQRLSGA